MAVAAAVVEDWLAYMDNPVSLDQGLAGGILVEPVAPNLQMSRDHEAVVGLPVSVARGRKQTATLVRHRQVLLGRPDHC